MECSYRGVELVPDLSYSAEFRRRHSEWGELALERDLQDAFETIDRLAPDPRQGLPEELFVEMTRFVPMINVDLLIRDEKGRLLLTWRDDEIDGRGWHVPGGIIRYKEQIATRIQATAARELSTSVTYRPFPVSIEQIANPERRVRGHFIALVYECSLEKPADEARRFDGDSPRAGDWSWFERCPDDIIEVHRRYRRFFRD